MKRKRWKKYARSSIRSEKRMDFGGEYNRGYSKEYRL